MRSRVVAALVDQGAYSLQTFAVAFTALHVLDLHSLGAFTLSSTVVILVQVTLRALAVEPLLIRFSDRSDRRRAAVSDAAGAVAAVTLFAFALTLLAWAALGDGARLVAAAGLLLVSVALQDTYRYTMFAADRTWSAALNDVVVCVLTFLGLGVLAASGSFDDWSLLVVWAGASAAGAALAMGQVGTTPRPLAARSWLRTHRDVGLPLMGSVLAQQSMGRLSLVIVSALAGAAQLGLLAASRTVLSPVNTLISSTYSFAVPEAVRRRGSAAAMTRFTSLLGLSLAGLAITLTVALLFLPEEWGRLLAGRNWEGARRLLVPTGLWISGVALSQGARVGLRAVERADLVLKVSVVLGVVMLVATTIGTLVDGGTGAAWGFGLASVVGQPLWTLAYRHALRVRTGAS